MTRYFNTITLGLAKKYISENFKSAATTKNSELAKRPEKLEEKLTGKGKKDTMDCGKKNKLWSRLISL